MASRPTPLERLPPVDADLRFAAVGTWRYRHSAAALRTTAVDIFQELGRRWEPVSEHMRQAQPPGLRQVTKARHLGLLTLMVALMRWPDTLFPHNLVVGFPGVGFHPWTGLFEQRDVTPISLAEVLADATDNNTRILDALHASELDDFILEQSEEDFSKGFCSQEFTEEELIIFLNGAPYRLIRRFAIEQGDARRRVIDDAADGDQSVLSVDANQLRFCSALHPAIHLRHLAQAARVDGASYPVDLPVFTGGEDWPDAFRFCPMDPAHARACVVVYWSAKAQAPRYRVYNGLLFGLPLAVTSFNRFPKLVEAIARRYLFLLFSMYFDDGTLQDWAVSAPTSQAELARLLDILGSPWAERKRQPCASQADFLGLEHDLSNVPSGTITFWPRARLVDNVAAAVQLAHESRHISRGQAAKLYGRVNFLDQGVYGKVGRAGLAALSDRARGEGPSWSPTLAATSIFSDFGDPRHRF